MYNNFVDRLINCIAHTSSDGQLLVGKEKTALFDCGMMFCGEKTIQNVKNALNSTSSEAPPGRLLDYLFLTHTHYDHLGALPLFRKEWEKLQVVTCEAGAAVLLKNTPRKVIRELSRNAAVSYNTVLNMDYDDDLLHADITVKENDSISLGDITVQIIETPGHTRDSLAFFIPEIELLIINETPGILLPDEQVYPLYLTSYKDTIISIEKCSLLPFKYLSMPHRGVASEKQTEGFFEKAHKINTTCRDFIIEMKNKNYNEEEMINSYYDKYSKALLDYQPKEAFLANARATITNTLKEEEKK